MSSITPPAVPANPDHAWDFTSLDGTEDDLLVGQLSAVNKAIDSLQTRGGLFRVLAILTAVEQDVRKLKQLEKDELRRRVDLRRRAG